MKRSAARLWCLALAGSLLFAGTPVCAESAAKSGEAEETAPAVYAHDSYAEYIASFSSEVHPSEPIAIAGSGYDLERSEGVRVETIDGRDAAVTDESSSVLWEFHVANAGLYALQFDYYPLEGSGGDIERNLRINGETPCTEVAPLVFQRLWKDETPEPIRDSAGNEYPQMQVQAPRWRTALARDSLGYVADPLYFYFREGLNTIELNAQKEPLAVACITLCQYEAPPSYDEVLDSYEEKGYQPVSEQALYKRQAEQMDLKSHSTLCAAADRTSPMTENTDISRVTLNAVGSNWGDVGQWISYEVEVEETGLYELAFRFKQNYMEGSLSTRALYIDGKLPFAETQNLEFEFSNQWQVSKLGGDEPYLFYFEADRTYTLTLECVMGYMGNVLWETQQSVYELNALYRKIKMIVGSFPDPNRDYGIDKQIPDCMDILATQCETLRRLAGIMEAEGQGKSSHYSMIQKLVVQMEGFIEDPDSIAVRLDTFSSNIAALSEFSLDAAYQPLTLDYFLLCPPGYEMPVADCGFWGKVWYEFRLFFQSFFSDYNAISTDAAGGSSVDVWMITGRDQAQTLRALAEKDFSAKNDIGVNIRLVKEDTVLPAVAANCGPDVALTMGRSVPVDYGLRSALLDLTQFEDLPEVLEWFSPQAAEPFRLGDKLFALPEQEQFLTMFYRRDILEELGLVVPETWDDLFDILYVLHQNGMDIGLPNVATADAAQAGSGTELYTMFLFQNGGDFYNADHSATLLDENTALESFEELMSLYTKYKVTTQMNHWSRFRSGEAPIILQSFTYYNTFESTAPELRGLWGMAPVPGTMREGRIDRTLSNTVSGSVIFANTSDPESSWRFLKWWLSEDTQVAYSQGLENLMGAAARVPTANLKAFERLSFPPDTLAAITAQRTQIRALPEVPGGYMVNRSINAAIRATISNGGNASEILLDRNKLMNKEIALRREEFGLDERS
jgi:extracellular solute-binding protein family 1